MSKVTGKLRPSSGDCPEKTCAAPARDAGVALVLPTVNIDMMNRHLAEISAHVLPGHHAVLTLDGAGWHQSGGRLKVPDRQIPPEPDSVADPHGKYGK